LGSGDELRQVSFPDHLDQNPLFPLVVEFVILIKSIRHYLTMQEEVKEWMDKAKSDLEIAKYDLKGDYYEDSCFHAQQAAEKSLKAVYIGMNKELLKIHDVKLLAQRVGAPDEIVEAGDELNPYYIAARYPVMEEPPGEKDAEEAIVLAEKVLKWAEKKV
jgi:HEPN domain-containing protein